MYKFIKPLVLIFSFGLYACTYNPLSENNHLTGNAPSTALGGAVGLGTAAALGATKPIPLVAATAAGASIGYYVSTLRFSSAGIYQVGGQVYKLGDYVTIEIPTDNIFEVNSTEPLPEAEPVLKSAANVLKRYGCQNIMISGNTSGFGTTKYERRISEGRAKEVAAFLWAEGINNFQERSINTRKLTYVGYGNYFPIASDLRNKGIRQNSRIQITSYPTRDQLLIDEKALAFNNMAGYDAAHLSDERSPYNGDTAAQSQLLAENSSSRSADFKGAYPENIGRYEADTASSTVHHVPVGGYKQEF
jgi:outer membrane protein OmpA-like peptidoglycan-associated protein